jgi:DNA invertase Pin-like site-specific DNA recombinase
VKVFDKPYLDLTTTIGGGFLAFLSALAQDERKRITGRANDGRVAALKRGARFGRKPKLTEHQQREARAPPPQGKRAADRQELQRQPRHDFEAFTVSAFPIAGRCQRCPVTKVQPPRRRRGRQVS